MLSETSSGKKSKTDHSVIGSLALFYLLTVNSFLRAFCWHDYWCWCCYSRASVLENNSGFFFGVLLGSEPKTCSIVQNRKIQEVEPNDE